MLVEYLTTREKWPPTGWANTHVPCTVTKFITCIVLPLSFTALLYVLPAQGVTPTWGSIGNICRTTTGTAKNYISSEEGDCEPGFR